MERTDGKQEMTESINQKKIAMVLMRRSLVRGRRNWHARFVSGKSDRPWVSSSRPSLEPRRPAPAYPLDELTKDLIASVRKAGTANGLNVVAYSGGVDSSLAAYLVREAFPSNSVAAIGITGAWPF